jgi:hypothetical protein
MVLATLIKKNNTIKTIDIDPEKLEESAENKGKNAIEQLHIFNFEGLLKVIVYGWTSGDFERDINKHELPPPIDNPLFYGDLIVLLRKGDNLEDFTKEDYEEFYEDIFDFDEISENESEIDSNDDYEYGDFVVRDSDCDE